MIHDYLTAGWRLCAIAPFSKGPTTPKWNDESNALKSADELPSHWGVGLMHSYSGTAALDIDNYALAQRWLQERGIDLNALMTAPDAVQIDSGNAGHGKLLYRVPLGMPLLSKKIIVDGVTALEFRCAASNGKTVQDVLPPSRHPSGSVYKWSGTGDWKRLPELSPELFDVWSTLIDDDRQQNIPVEPNVMPTSMEEIRSALFAINPDCPRATWINVGMAIRDAMKDQLEAGFNLWNEWSATGNKYKPAEMMTQWKSFKDRPEGIHIGTLFHHAYSYGWRRPAPNVEHFFNAIPERHQQAKDMITLVQGCPVVDVSMWPEQLSGRALEVAKEVGCDVIVPLIAGLSAVSAAANKRINLSITDTWQVPPTVWLMTIGEPADKKTPGSKPMFVPLRQLEVDDKPRHAAEKMAWEGKEARYAAQQKAMREWQASPEAELPNAVPPKMDGLPDEPKNLRLLIQDATTQKVVSMASGRPRGFLLYLDEMNRWLTKLSDTRNTDDRGCWIQGYETGPYTMDRQGAGTIHAENLAMSIYGNCQPAVFRENLAAAALDGIVQRFLPVTIDPKQNTMWQDAVPSKQSCAPAYDALLRRVFNLPVFTYLLTPEANQLFREFCQWAMRIRELERTLKSHDAYQTALGKMEGNCARIALLFHLMGNPHSMFVEADTMAKTVSLMREFFVPSLRYVYLEVGHQRDTLGALIADHILQVSTVRPSVGMGELRAAGKSAIAGRSAQQFDSAIRITMDELSSMGYVTVLTDHYRHPTWAINPAIAETYKDERKAIISAKQAVIEQMRGNLAAKGKTATVRNALGYADIA